MITEISSIQNYLKPLNIIDMILSFQNIHKLQSDNSRFVSHRKCSAMINNMSTRDLSSEVNASEAAASV